MCLKYEIFADYSDARGENPCETDQLMNVDKFLLYEFCVKLIFIFVYSNGSQTWLLVLRSCMQSLALF